MATWEFKLPDLGEGVTEGEIVAWLIKAGEPVVDDQPLIEVMTDKATMTITSPKRGTVRETRGAVGDIVAVHSVLAVFEIAGDATLAIGTALKGATVPDASAPAGESGVRGHTMPVAAAPAPSASQAAESVYFTDKPLATPATRKLARERNVDLRVVAPTGSQGRVTREDVERFAAAGAYAAIAAPRSTAMLPPSALDAPGHGVSKGIPGPAHVAAPARELVKISPPAGTPAGLETRVPFAGMRRKIATKMSQSKNTAAHFTFVEECDVSKLRELRARLRGHAEEKGVKLTFLPFIVKAVVAALKRHPTLNSALDESTNEVVTRRYHHIGIAASTDAGLIVPVVRDADKKSILEVAAEIERLANDAKHGKAKAEDLSGSTFTITSLGAQGGLFATPIINFPEVGILGVHQIKERPVVREGQIVIGHVMLLSLSFDHRIVDGHVGAAFAYDVIGLLQDPDRLLLELA